MKKILLLLTILAYSTASFSQSYFMSGRFSNTTPDINAGIDSGIFIFTPTTYEYYINTNPNPSSKGNYWVVPGGNTDTLYLDEDSLGVCAQNGSGITVWFNVDYTVSPYYSIIVTESANSVVDCPSHSQKIKGDYIAWGNSVVIPFPTSVGTTPAQSYLRTNVYNGQLSVSGPYNEKISVVIMNLNGQKVISNKEAMLFNGNTASFDLDGLSPGMYFAVIQSEHERKAIKFTL